MPYPLVTVTRGSHSRVPPRSDGMSCRQGRARRSHVGTQWLRADNVACPAALSMTTKTHTERRCKVGGNDGEGP